MHNNKVAGLQVVAEFSGCACGKLDDRAALEETIIASISACGMNLMQVQSYHFNPQGVTVVAIIGESHIALHTFPESGHVSLDIYHCTDTTKGIFELVAFLENWFQSSKTSMLKLARGENLGVIRE